MIGWARAAVKTYFGEPRAEGGGLELEALSGASEPAAEIPSEVEGPRWLMGRSPIWQIVSSTHWQRPPNTICHQHLTKQ